jgi:hypothetical protein
MLSLVVYSVAREGQLMRKETVLAEGAGVDIAAFFPAALGATDLSDEEKKRALSFAAQAMAKERGAPVRTAALRVVCCAYIANRSDAIPTWVYVSPDRAQSTREAQNRILVGLAPRAIKWLFDCGVRLGFDRNHPDLVAIITRIDRRIRDDYLLVAAVFKARVLFDILGQTLARRDTRGEHAPPSAHRAPLVGATDDGGKGTGALDAWVKRTRVDDPFGGGDWEALKRRRSGIAQGGTNGGGAPVSRVNESPLCGPPKVQLPALPRPQLCGTTGHVGPSFVTGSEYFAPDALAERETAFARYMTLSRQFAIGENGQLAAAAAHVFATDGSCDVQRRSSPHDACQYRIRWCSRAEVTKRLLGKMGQSMADQSDVILSLSTCHGCSRACSPQ